MVHGLKIAHEHFAGQLAGTKTFELRADDRDFAVGDTLCLREWVDGAYTGRSVFRQVVGLLRGPAYGLQQGWVILSTAAPVEPLRAALLALEADAHFIFNNPPGEAPQAVRDVIEWYAASVRVALEKKDPS